VDAYATHLGLAVALAVGLLVGLEREQTRDERKASFAGVRTYPIFALIGAVSMLLAPWVPLVALVGVIVLVAISYAAGVKGGDHGVTTEASVIATFLLGALAEGREVIEPMSDRLILVAALGVAMTFLLSAKPLLHKLASRVSRDDLYATLKFLIVTVVVLPLLPHRDVGPLGAIDPFNVGLMIVTISGLSFLGYIAMRWLGPRRGVLVGAALGGLVSSTAVTVSFSARTKASPTLAPVAAGAIAIASAIMVVRVGVLVALTAPELLASLWIVLAGMVVGALVGGLLVFRKVADGDGAPDLKNPFELGSAIKFGLVFGAVLLATKAAQHYLGDRGLYLAASLAGTTDVDAITLSTAKLARSGTAPDVATLAIALAVAVNTLVKTGLAFGLGGVRLGLRAAIIGGGAIGLAIAQI